MPTEETTEETEGLTLRSAMHIHEGQVAWIESTRNVDLSEASPAEVIAYAYATRVAWRKTEEYQTVKAEQAEITAAEKAEQAEAKEAAKAERAAEREAAKAAKEAERQAKAAEKEAAKGEAPAKQAAKPAAKKATAKKATSAKASKGSGDADPFA